METRDEKGVKRRKRCKQLLSGRESRREKEETSKPRKGGGISTDWVFFLREEAAPRFGDEEFFS